MSDETFLKWKYLYHFGRFIRCDLYEFKGNVYFGELTFFPDAGMGVFSPPDADLTVGAMWTKESA